ncbi:hypothetical protein QBC42DRAFT_305031 [Cladorrhinum samala]|uniref:Uncharacterized protein n=1 Tax=Cladorrhinum samala TaxID=585594 RepID=A0AAV9HR89_9PEZI|nr:hypothetical protein QBC42DRAFT_305031 [Cladorrhinum samala]
MSFSQLKRRSPLIPLGGIVASAHDVLPPQPTHQVSVVVASLKRDNTSWIREQLPRSWKPSIYVVDDPKADLTVPLNKGREAMVYLTYIIANYDALPPVSLFIHASRFAWHNDNPDYDSLASLLSLNIPYILERGYANLRCVWVLGCPAELRPLADVNPVWEDYRKSHPPNKHEVTTKEVYKQAFGELLPGETVPEVVGVSCCAQFAVSKEGIRRRRKEDYVRWRNWLIETPLVDEVSGRVLEYMWHIMFGQKAVFCPSAEECYCGLYGMCNLRQCSERGCEGQYTLPKVATLPQGWPLIGWEGEERNYSGPAL